MDITDRATYTMLASLENYVGNVWQPPTISKTSIIYYRFIVRFPIGLDFLFVTFLLHLLISWTSSLSISSSAISASTLSNHVFLGLPTGLLPSTLYFIHFFTQSSSPFLITCLYHLSLPLLMKVVIGSTPTSLSILHLSFCLSMRYHTSI